MENRLSMLGSQNRFGEGFSEALHQIGTTDQGGNMAAGKNTQDDSWEDAKPKKGTRPRGRPKQDENPKASVSFRLEERHLDALKLHSGRFKEYPDMSALVRALIDEKFNLVPDKKEE